MGPGVLAHYASQGPAARALPDGDPPGGAAFCAQSPYSKTCPTKIA